MSDKPKKTYEIRAEIERKIRWLGEKKSKYQNFLDNAVRDIEKTKQYHAVVMGELETELKHRQSDIDTFDGLLKIEKKKLEDLNRVSVPVVELPKAAVADDGKILCDLCGKKFASQGYSRHRKTCADHQKALQELARLEQLKKELEEENGGAV